jgi:hypothetical protein
MLVLEALERTWRRKLGRLLVLLSCNTLAPAAWALEEHFSSAERLVRLVREARVLLEEDFAAWKAERRDAAYAQAQKEAAAQGGVVDTFNYNADMIEQPDGTYKFKDNWNFTWKKA